MPTLGGFCRTLQLQVSLGLTTHFVVVDSVDVTVTRLEEDTVDEIGPMANDCLAYIQVECYNKSRSGLRSRSGSLCELYCTRQKVDWSFFGEI